ncbi:MAG: hypothetical protein V3V16_05655, partial [Melioribacteraceae bacterium]
MKLLLIIILCFSSLLLESSLFAQKNSHSNSITKVPLSLLAKQPIQNHNPFQPKIDYGMLAGVGAITLGAGVAVHIYQANSWWADQGTTFKIINDWKYALWL